MFTNSIRWRMQLWLAFLLVCILSGFGLTAYQLQRNNWITQIDTELNRRISILNSDIRGHPFLGPPPGRLPFEPGQTTNMGSFNLEPPPDRPPFEPGPRRRSPDSRGPRGRPDEPGQSTNLNAFDPSPPPERPPFEPGRDPSSMRRRSPDSRGPRGRMDEFFENREIHLSVRTLNLFEQTETNDYYYAIWSRSGNLLKHSTNAPAEVPLPARLNSDPSIQMQMRGPNREAFLFTEIGECILVGRNITSDLVLMQRLAWWLAAAGAAILALGLGGGWLLASRAFRPVEEISAIASRISVGNLAERINVEETSSELSRLARVLNSTFARLEAAFAQQKQFTADASHELRTPIAVIISEAQTTLARERTSAEYRQTVETCLDAAQEMRKLTQSLLELARYDAGQESLQRQPLDLAERTRDGLELIRPLARERGLQIHTDLGPANILGDTDRLGQVIINLLTNAIEYNRPQGEIRVSTRIEANAAILEVADTGPGIAVEDLPHLFKRFYRADKSRSSAQGRSGLGLAICKAIVEAHGGSLEVTSQLGVGSKFTVKLPQ